MSRSSATLRVLRKEQLPPAVTLKVKSVAAFEALCQHPATLSAELHGRQGVARFADAERARQAVVDTGIDVLHLVQHLGR